MALLKGGTYVDGNLIVEGTLYLADLMRLDNDQYVYSNKGNTVQNRLLKYSGSASVEADNSLIYSNDDSLYVTTGLNPDSSSLSASEKAAALAQVALSLTGIEGSTPSLKVSSISTDTLSSKSSKVITVSANHWISTADPYTYSASTVSASQSSYVATIHSLTNVLKAFQNAGYPISITGTNPAVSCTIGSVEASVPQDGSSALITSNAVYDAISSIRTEAPGSDGSSQYIQDVTQGTSNKLKVVVSKMTADSSPILNSKKLITSNAVYDAISTIVTSANADDTSQYIQAVTQGTSNKLKVVVKQQTADSSPTLNSKKLITSGAVYNDLSTIVASANAGDNSQYIQAVTQGTDTNAKKVIVSKMTAETEIARQGAKKLITSGAVYNDLSTIVASADADDNSQYIQAVTQGTGTSAKKVVVKQQAADSSPTLNSKKLITSGAVYNDLSTIVTSANADDTSQYIQAVTQGTSTNVKKVVVKQQAAETEIARQGAKKLITSGAVYNDLSTIVASADASDTSQYIQDVTQGAGTSAKKVVVSKMTADSSPTLNSKKLITSGAVYKDLSTIVASADADDSSQYIQAVTQGAGANVKKVVVKQQAAETEIARQDAKKLITSGAVFHSLEEALSGQIDAINIAADDTPKADSNKFITSKAVYNTVSSIISSEKDTSADADGLYTHAVIQGTGDNTLKIIVKQLAADTGSVAGSKNLITSGAVYNEMRTASGYVTLASSYATNARNSSTSASSSATAAATYASNALVSESHASDFSSNASSFASQASNYRLLASSFAANSSASASQASSFATNALGSATDASNFASNASGSASGASTSATQASSYRLLASSFAANASTSATSASGSASNANTYKSNASSFAAKASSSASSASTSATQASSYQLLASSYAANSSTSASSASGSASSASTYKSNASSFAANASSSASSASTYATQASSYQLLASSYAANANTYKSNASTYATQASSYQLLASSYAANANTYKNNASYFAANASSSASSASTYATQASSYQLQASSYRLQASSYAANSSTSAANASSYAAAINASLNAGPSKVTVKKANTKASHYLIGVDCYSGSGFLRTREDLYVSESGNLNCLSLTATSARSKKQDIVPTTHVNAVKEINGIDIVDFTYKADSEKNHHVGFIADDTAEVFATKKHDVMDINNCIGMLLKAVQELSYINKKQNEEIAALHDQVDQIDSFLQASVKEV